MMRVALTCVLVATLVSCESGDKTRREGPSRVSFEVGSNAIEQPSPAASDAPPTATTGTDQGVTATDSGHSIPPAPEDYGLVKPPFPPPPPEELTVHALAGYEVVAIYAKPDLESIKLGYLRIGARLKVGPKIEGEGCPGGWHALPVGGFACAGKGLVVDPNRPPFMKFPPPAPSLNDPLPYTYGYVRRWNTPMWWRVPTADELARAKEQRAVLEAEREAQLAAEEMAKKGGQAEAKQASPPDKEPAKQASPPDKEPAEPASPPKKEPEEPKTPKAAAPTSLPSLDEGEPAKAPGDSVQPPPAEPAAPTQPPEPGKQDVPATSPKEPAAAPAEPEEPPPPLPLSPATPWLEKGFFLSLAEKVREGGKTWWRTARGAYVQSTYVYKHKPKDFQGVELGEEISFPVGWVMSEEEKLYELSDENQLVVKKKVPQRTFLDLAGETEIRGKTYMMTTDGLLVRKKIMRIPELQPVPKGIQPWERWIDVSLSRQILVAYVGSTPVFVTLVSTGKKGTEEEPFETPVGRWRINSKHISTTMAGNTASDGNYAIQDVPWGMFFEGSYALHGAFWHRGYGYVRSHGCVNLGPSDARWLFFWTTPFLPEGWHGVHATDDSPGTTVIIRE